MVIYRKATVCRTTLDLELALFTPEPSNVGQLEAIAKALH